MSFVICARQFFLMGDPSKIFDGFLVLQYRSGKKHALGLLVNRYHKKLCRHSFGYTRDVDVSQDIVQDCWSIIINKLDSLKEPNRFGSWAFRIVTRRSLDFVRKKKWEIGQVNSFPDLQNEVDTKNDNETLIHNLQLMIRVLPKEQQVVLRLFYTEDYSLKEIAEILEISVGTVKSRLFHAREKLKTILKT